MNGSSEHVDFEPHYTPFPEGLHISDNPKKSKPCPTCTQTIMLNPKCIYTRNIDVLREIARVNIQNGRPAEMEDVSKFGRTMIDVCSKEQRSIETTYTRLKYWELIEPVEIMVKDRKGKDVEAHGWKITKEGVDFLNGKIRIPKQIWIFNDLVREHPTKEKKFVYVHEVERAETINRKIAAKQAEKLEPTNQ